MRRTLLIDTDTASDDAVALIMALRSTEVEVAAITTVAGNVPVEQATANALFTAELCGSRVPIFPGAKKPLTRDLQPATWFHGLDGLGDVGYGPPTRKPETTHAAEAIAACALANPGLEIVTLGPLTNLAMALKLEPRIVQQIGRVVIMGGAPCCEGNVTPAAEFNIWVDPEAARLVFLSGLPIEMVGWQLSRFDAVLHQHDIDQILALQNPLADFAIRCNGRAREAYLEQTGEDGIALPDPTAMAILLDPALALETSSHYVDIETQSTLTRGMTVVDKLNVTHDNRNPTWPEVRATAKPSKIVWKLDIPGWKKLLLQSLTKERE